MDVKIYRDHIDWNTFGMIMEPCRLNSQITQSINGLHIKIQMITELNGSDLFASPGKHCNHRLVRPPCLLGSTFIDSNRFEVLCVQEDDRDITSRVVVVVGAHKKVFVMISDRCI